MDQAIAGLLGGQGGGVGQPPPPNNAPPPPPSPLGAPPQDPASMPGAEPSGPADQATFEAHLHNFTHEAVKDFIAGKISRQDLNKATSYTGGEDYHSWKQQNTERLKSMHKHQEKTNKERGKGMP